MKKRNNLSIYGMLIVVFSLMLIVGCQSKPTHIFGSGISMDQENIANGSKLFKSNCSSCHSFESKVIGPNLSGLTRTVETQWVKNFITNSKKLVEAKDERAVALFEKYNVYMPSFTTFSDQEMNDMLSYMHTYETLPVVARDSTNSLKDPIPEKITDAGMSVHLELFAEIPHSSDNLPYTRINKMGYEMGSGRLFVNDLRGFLYELKNGKPTVYLDVKERFSNFYHESGIGSGLGSFAFHPNYKNNGLFYTSHTESITNKTADFQLPEDIKPKVQYVLTEWHDMDKNAAIFSGTQREIMRIDFVTEGHGVQEIAFNPRVNKEDVDFGKLYMCIGDGVAVQLGYPQVVDQPGKEIWGTILRIDPLGTNSTNAKYGIPADNPLIKMPNKSAEIWAYGFRNPNRLAWDYSGRLLSSDVGQTNIEEINLVESGGFYGWPIREGSFVLEPKANLDVVYALPENDADFDISYPLIEYDHDEGPAVCGGYIVDNQLMKNKYIFGDIPTGRIFIADIVQPTSPKIQELGIVIDNKKTDLYTLTNSNRVDLKFGEGRKGIRYVFTKADGKIYKINAIK